MASTVENVYFCKLSDRSLNKLLQLRVSEFSDSIFAYGMHHSRVVLPAECPSDFRITVFGQLLTKIHCDLTRTRKLVARYFSITIAQR